MASRRGQHLPDLHDHDRERAALLRRHQQQLLPPASASGPHPAASALQDRLVAIDRDIQALLLDNQRLAAVHVALRQELLQSQHEVRLASASASRAHEAKNAELRDAVDRSRHAHAAAARVEAVRAEIGRVAGDVRRLSLSRDEMVQRLVGMRGDLGRKRAENGSLEVVAKEMESMRSELEKGRAAIEFEKKVHADNEEQSKSMETNMLSMMREIDRLRAELVNTQKRAQAAAAATNPNPGLGYPGSYGNPPEAAAAAAAAAAYASYGAPYNQVQAQRTPDATAQYVPGTDTHPSYNMQQTPTQR